MWFKVTLTMAARTALEKKRLWVLSKDTGRETGLAQQRRAGGRESPVPGFPLGDGGGAGPGPGSTLARAELGWESTACLETHRLQKNRLTRERGERLVSTWAGLFGFWNPCRWSEASLKKP